jgi:hypothetical protein
MFNVEESDQESSDKTSEIEMESDDDEYDIDSIASPYYDSDWSDADRLLNCQDDEKPLINRT